ncbi:MAG TPA: hypothetical protein VHQ48_17130 [Bradyrhizobium sp.]|nr:hypothetical protein [Bradyrhizobium sp.]
MTRVFFWGVHKSEIEHKTDPPDKSPAANAIAIKRWAASDRQDQIAAIKIEKWSWKKGGFDSVMIGTFTIKNSNDFGVKDIVLNCEHFAPSGTLIDSNTRTVYQSIKPKSSITVRDFNMGFLHTQATRSSCSVTNFS